MDILTPWSVAIFARNEARTIVDCLDSVLLQGGDSGVQVYVLVNGSRDATERIVSDYAATHAGVTLVRLSLADKASAWNYYVHTLCPAGDVHFFVDGDVTVMPNSFRALLQALRNAPAAKAAGALPVTGRDRVGWSQRMLAFGRLAGGLYAVRGEFVSDLRNRAMRIPAGLIGEDLFLSLLVKDLPSRNGLVQPSSRLVFATAAGFAFKPLALSRPGDWITYGRRLVRYQIRSRQLAMLLRHMETHPQSDLPADVETLYQQASDLPGYYWRGRITPFDLLAVWKIRRAARKRASASTRLSE